MKNGSFPLCPKWIRDAGPFAVTVLLVTAAGCATLKQTFARPPGALGSDPRATALVVVDCHLLTQLGWTGRGDMLVHGASIRGEDALTQLFEPMLRVKFGDVCILFQGLPPGGYRVSEIVTVSMDYNANTKGVASQLHGFNVSGAEDLAFKAGPGELVYVGRFHPYVRGLALTRSRGHHPKGGYDVPHGQERRTPTTAQVQ